MGGDVSNDKTFDITDLMGENGVGKFRLKESDKLFAKTIYVKVERNVLEGGLISCSMSTGSTPDGSRADYIWLDN